ncbi:GNAT domain [Macleaya cordata]|uniref:N-alpha-acetyltransferase 40 n=1 Tax=Macleaya cordata TaxID=56857 RepID=A0A200QM79_MACCD|nr:GNAT domain [Macleaya cordata]
MEQKRFEFHNNNILEKKMKRREVLEKNKALDEIIRNAASIDKDHLQLFPPFRQYNRNGLSVYLESGYGSQLSSPMKQYIQNLLKVNMEGLYGSEWPTEEKVKRREMVAPEARYIFVREARNASVDEISPKAKEEKNCSRWMGDGDPVVGFVEYRYIVEEEIPVAYVYELQLEHHVQGKGLGKFLMQLIELIARKNRMSAVMLTVQKANLLAMNFYTSKLRYMISTISPSRVDPLIGAKKSYEILCKAFDHEAKEKLEDAYTLVGEGHGQ